MSTETKRTPLRSDWTPRNRVELCACIAVLAMQGHLTPDDERYVSDYLTFRADNMISPSHTRPTTP